MSESFERTESLLGAKALNKLHNSSVAVFGIGGVGGYVVEGLVRCGIGKITLVDNDSVSRSNINRQIIATENNIGKLKTECMQKRISEINPGCKVKSFNIFILPENIEDFDFSSYDYVVDAIDTVSGKLAIIEACKRDGIPVISSMGTGNKLNPTLFKITDIFKTDTCPLAKVMRTELRKRGIKKLKVLYSSEVPIKTSEQKTDERGRLIPGSVSFVPSVAGMIIAGEVIKDLSGETE